MIQQVQLVRETRKVERMIEVDGEQSQLRVELQLNNANGQFKIVAPITTKQVSRNPAVRAALMQQIAAMMEEAMVAALEFRDEWGANDRDDDEGDLFNQDNVKGPAEREDLENETESPEGDLDDSEQHLLNENFPDDDEDANAATRLSLDAPPAKKQGRGRSNRKVHPASDMNYGPED